MRSLAPIFSFVLMVSGCTLFSNNATAVLWTDRPEVAAYVELFNTESDSGRVEVVYKEVPWLALENSADHPDLVIGTRLDSSLAIGNFAPLDKLQKKERITPSYFYPDLLAMGMKDGNLHLLPVSFSLPIMVFKAELGLALADSQLISLEELRMLCGDFNIVDDLPTRMGYSASWQPDFMYALAVIYGADFRESDERLPFWNNPNVVKAMDFAAEWSTITNGGYDIEDSFHAKYMYDPLYKLLDTSRILFTFMQIEDFLSVPAAIRETLDFRWLSDGMNIYAGEDVLYAGITRQSRKRRTAEDFLAWLFLPETQDKLLESAAFERMRSFGVANGLSSLASVNGNLLPRYFDFLLGHIPDGADIRFPNRLPESWEEARSNVIFPWFSDVTEDGETEHQLADLLRQWQLQHPDLYR
ncbi:MAG: hypothetical protein HN368_00990 [Spirochaetales bacterium]|jgi:hypothetical protein|nr:hypothetical protein [Spirochaetales bacterium]